MQPHRISGEVVAPTRAKMREEEDPPPAHIADGGLVACCGCWLFFPTALLHGLPLLRLQHAQPLGCSRL